MAVRIPIDEGRIAAFCRRHRIPRLAVFGSVLREDFGPGSDVDVLVEFDGAHIPGLIRLAAMEIELSAILGYKADLRTQEDLSRYFRQQVVDFAETLYASG